jgi:hypothetical protein
LTLEEVVAALAAAVQRDDRLSVLVGGPAATRLEALEQQVLGLVSHAAFRPYFVLQSTQVSHMSADCVNAESFCDIMKPIASYGPVARPAIKHVPASSIPMI